MRRKRDGFVSIGDISSTRQGRINVRHNQVPQTAQPKRTLFLLRKTLGRGTFRLSEQFMTKLTDCLDKGSKKRLSIPSDAFVAMDYHLDWIQTALYPAAKSGSSRGAWSEELRLGGPGAPWDSLEA